MKVTDSNIFNAIEAKRDDILQTERWLWANPEAGFKEWKTHKYLVDKFRTLGLDVIEAGNIPGFYCDIDTGREGPTVAIFGELDALIIPNHPEADKETGCVHSCGHHCQATGLYGVAIGLCAEGALDGLCGKIRLIGVPAEELIDIDFRESLRQRGIIRYLGGKTEFMYRGILDGVDMAMMIHTGSSKAHFYMNSGSNGCVRKKAIFRGKACHASSPYGGLNALYAATTALTAANAVRETFNDINNIRFHPIITKGGDAVNVIPDEVVVESYIRGATVKAIFKVNEQINRVFAASAAAMGCTVELIDEMGYSPRNLDRNLRNLFAEAAKYVFDESEINISDDFGAGCSDMGDVSMVIPSVHPYCGGAVGEEHGTDYYIKNPENACVRSAKVQCAAVFELLKEDAKAAKEIIAKKKTAFGSIKEYFEFIDKLKIDKQAVTFREDGVIELNFKQ